jgi:hypothetical protein
MQVSELYSLIKWIDAEIVAKKVVKRYAALQNILANNAQQNQPK